MPNDTPQRTADFQTLRNNNRALKEENESAIEDAVASELDDFIRISQKLDEIDDQIDAAELAFSQSNLDPSPAENELADGTAAADRLTRNVRRVARSLDRVANVLQEITGMVTAIKTLL